MLLERMVALMRDHPEAVVGYPDWWMLDPHGERIEEQRLPPFALEDLFARGVCVPGPGAIIHREGVYPFVPLLRDPMFVTVSDYASWLNLARLGPFVHLPESIAHWRNHEAAETFKQRGARIAWEHVRLAYRFFSRPDVPPHLRQYEADMKLRMWELAAEMVAPYSTSERVLASSIAFAMREPSDRRSIVLGKLKGVTTMTTRSHLR